MAKITLNDIMLYGFHGCFEEEQKIGTFFKLNISFSCNTSKAEKTDNIEDTINYLSVFQTIKKTFEKPCHLLEALARNICEELLKEFPLMEDCSVEVKKLNPPLGGQLSDVSVFLSVQRTPSK
ncbi:MAG: dihydroneopterin aldolase [Bacteroidales bacterium]|nr:dihydroneopterin aldolase [Bacteroidales bacterium]